MFDTFMKNIGDKQFVAPANDLTKWAVHGAFIKKLKNLLEQQGLKPELCEVAINYNKFIDTCVGLNRSQTNDYIRGSNIVVLYVYNEYQLEIKCDGDGFYSRFFKV